MLVFFSICTLIKDDLYIHVISVFQLAISGCYIAKYDQIKLLHRYHK
jgi:hypothetical protein